MPRGGHRKGSGRKPSWNHSETQTIRVPVVFAEQLLEIAKRLDRGELIEFVTKSKKNKSQNQSEIVTKSKSQKDSVTKSKNETVSESLSQRQLAKRLGCDPRRLADRRNDPALLAEWTKGRDPSEVAWSFNADTGEYFPIL